MGTRWLGVGLASCLAAVTLALAVTGRLALYVNPDSTWFAVAMAIVLLLGAIASFALPLGAEEDHGHDHGEDHDHDHDARPGRADAAAKAATIVGGIAASGVVLTMLVMPPASLSAELAMSRDIGAPPLFAGADVITLATSGDTSEFGVGDWASVFATATNPDAFDGAAVTLTGFVTPGDAGAGFDLTRLVITHCVIDAQTASLPIADAGPVPETGQWVTVSGTVRASGAGVLQVSPEEVVAIDEPQDPYEY